MVRRHAVSFRPMLVPPICHAPLGTRTGVAATSGGEPEGVHRESLSPGDNEKVEGRDSAACIIAMQAEKPASYHTSPEDVRV